MGWRGMAWAIWPRNAWLFGCITSLGRLPPGLPSICECKHEAPPKTPTCLQPASFTAPVIQAAVVGVTCRQDVVELLEKRVKSRFR